MAKTSGVILLVQEGRFKLALDDGRKQLFLLAHRSRVDGDDLHRYAQDGIHVEVEYGAAPGLIACAARDVAPTAPH